MLPARPWPRAPETWAGGVGCLWGPPAPGWAPAANRCGVAGLCPTPGCRGDLPELLQPQRPVSVCSVCSGTSWGLLSPPAAQALPLGEAAGCCASWRQMCQGCCSPSLASRLGASPRPCCASPQDLALGEGWVTQSKCQWGSHWRWRMPMRDVVPQPLLVHHKSPRPSGLGLSLLQVPISPWCWIPQL